MGSSSPRFGVNIKTYFFFKPQPRDGPKTFYGIVSLIYLHCMANYFNLSVPVRFKAISGKITKNPEESFMFFLGDSRTCQTLCINESFIIPHNGNAAAEKKYWPLQWCPSPRNVFLQWEMKP